MLKITACACSIPCFPSYNIKNMSIEEKVGQIMMVHFRGKTINDEAKALIQDIKVGGFIYYTFANGLSSPKQIQTLSLQLQALATIPLLIATDQEGGKVTRLKDGFTKFPGNAAIGLTADPTLAMEAAIVMGEEMHAVGINMNLAPVVDINSNINNPVIGNRAFGNCPKTVVDFGVQALKGFKKANVITTLKHFPGHGDTSEDSHVSLPINNKTMQQLEEMELIPFATLESDVIMTAHMLVPSFDKEHCSTLSFKTLNFLRQNLRFKGVIISDSLVMEGVLKKCLTVENAASQALQAGCDILLLGGRQLNGTSSLELKFNDIQRIHKSIVKSIKDNKNLESRLNDAVEKILDLKEKYLCVQHYQKSQDLNLLINTLEHQELALKIETLSNIIV